MLALIAFIMSVSLPLASTTIEKEVEVSMRFIFNHATSGISCISGSNIVGSACTCMPSEPSHARMVGVINSFSEAAGEQRWSGSKWAFFAPSSGRGLK